jgi:hypothetical protein
MEGIATLGTLHPQHAITQLVKGLADPARAFAFGQINMTLSTAFVARAIVNAAIAGRLPCGSAARAPGPCRLAVILEEAMQQRGPLMR